MKIDVAREGGAAVLRLGGRLDREGAEHLSHALENLVREGARSLSVDLSTVTYVSSAATEVLLRWEQELAVLRGQVKLTSLSPAVNDMFALAGWDTRTDAMRHRTPVPDLRQSTWQARLGAATSGQYELSSCLPGATLRCRLHGHPNRLDRAPFSSDDCSVFTFPSDVFGFGLGAIGGSYDECRERLGELLGVAGCVAYFPSDGARMADYLVGDGPTPPRAMLASGLRCEGSFSHLVRFGPQAQAESIPLSELVDICLEAANSKLIGLVVAGETAGLAGTKLRRSPATDDASLMRFDVPAVRDWFSFAPERTHSMTTALIAGVAARAPKDPLAAHLRPLDPLGRLYGHFHAAVFSYRPLPQRTVELGALLRGLFKQHQLRDVLHLVWDDRGDAGVGESVLVRGVGWVAPIAEVV